MTFTSAKNMPHSPALFARAAVTPAARMLIFILEPATAGDTQIADSSARVPPG